MGCGEINAVDLKDTLYLIKILRLEVSNLQLPVDDELQNRGLNPSNGCCFPFSIGSSSCEVHTNQPIQLRPV